MRQILKPINSSRLATINDDDGMVNLHSLDEHEFIKSKSTNLFWTDCGKENVHNNKTTNNQNKSLFSTNNSFVNSSKQCSINKNSKKITSLSLSTSCIINLKIANNFKMCQQFYFAIIKSLNTLINYPSIVIWRRSKTVQTILISLVIVALCSITYWNSLNGDFVHDDLPAIVQNPDVLGTTSIRKLFTNDFWGRPMSDPESHKSYRPITTLTFRLNMMHSQNPFGFHLVNVILHILVSLLVCILSGLVFQFDTLQTLAAGALFATHPIHSEAVSSMVGRADVLCALFYLAAFLTFHCSLQTSLSLFSQTLFLMLFVLCTTLALLSKEIGITILGVCAFHWWCTIRKQQRSPQFASSSPSSLSSSINQVVPFSFFRFKHFTPIGAILLSFFVLMTFRLKLLSETWPFFSDQDNPASHSKSPITRILTYLYLAVFNVQLLLWPQYQAYDWQTSSIRLVHSWSDYRNLETLLLLATIGLLIRRICLDNITNGQMFLRSKLTETMKKKTEQEIIENNSLILASVLILMPYLPASNLFITVGFVVAERLLYIPSIGFICLVCMGIKRLQNERLKRKKKKKYYIKSNYFDGHQRYRWYRLLIHAPLTTMAHYRIQLALFTLIGVFAAKTIQQNRAWCSRESLYKSGIVNVPENAKAHYNYGNLQQDIGNWMDAMYHYQTAIRLWPKHASAHNNLGTLYWKILKTDHAERHFVQALNINPYHAKAHFNLGKVYSKRGQTLKAISLMERSIRLDRRFGESYEALAALYAHLGQLTLAERFYTKAIRLRPRNADFHNNYGAFLQKTGRLEYARRHYNRALELKPDHQIALVNMANLLTVLNRFDQAEYFYKRAIKLKKDLSTLDLLGTLYLRRSKLDLARLVYQGLWARYSAVAENVQSTSGSKLSNLSTEPETKAKLLNEYRTELRQPSSANIHYAQLLILEKRFAEAEVLLEALTTRFRQNKGNQNGNNNNDNNINNNNENANYGKNNGKEYGQNEQQGSLMDIAGYVEQEQQILVESSINGNSGIGLRWAHVSKSMSTNFGLFPLQPNWNQLDRSSIGNSKSSAVSQLQQQHSSLEMDVFHQLALLYTITNRTAEALDSITKALKLCPSLSSASTLERLVNDHSLSARCAQIYTLRGDIEKDLHRWQPAIQSYKKALMLDECQPRAHLHLAVIYHLGEQYAPAMFHYTLAHQLDHSSNRKLIDENLSKLRFRIQRLTIHSEDKLALYEYSSSSSDHYLNRHCKARFLRPAAGFGIYPNLNPANNNNVNQSSGQRWSSATTMETSKISSTSFFTSLDHHYHSNVLSISPPILSSY